MELDYELLRNILEHIEEATDGQERHTISRETFPDSSIQCVSFDVLAYHFDILCLNEFVAGVVLRSRLGGHKVATNIDYFNLTFEGHKLLDSMRNQTLWKNIKSRAQEFGVEGLKQIPALVLAYHTVQNNAPEIYVRNTHSSVQICAWCYPNSSEHCHDTPEHDRAFLVGVTLPIQYRFVVLDFPYSESCTSRLQSSELYLTLQYLLEAPQYPHDRPFR